MESSLYAGQQLLPLLHCLLQLLPSHLTLLLKVLQASSLQLCSGLLTGQAFYQHFNILGSPGNHLGKEQGVVGVRGGNLGGGAAVP